MESAAGADRSEPHATSWCIPRPAGDDVAPQGDQGPDGLDNAERPGPGQEAVGAGQGAAEGEGQDEDPAARLPGRTSPS